MINFDNTQVAFAIKNNNELRRAYDLYQLISYPWLVILGNGVIGFASKIGLPVRWVVKPTVYKQFVGGETIEECTSVVEKLATKNVKSILDYSVEGTEEDVEIEKAHKETMRTIDFAESNENIPFAVFKPTAFIQSKALEVLSNNKGMAERDIEEGNKFRDRVDRLCKSAFDKGVPIMIDAEDSFYQPFIDQVVYEMQVKYNKGRAIVYNTYQMYRTDRLDVLKKDFERAEKEGFFLGAKFVRGAYMERERARASRLNYPDPIQPDKESTDKSYNAALAFSVEKIERIAIFNGTHNEYSSNYLTELMAEKGLKNDDSRIWFSQLYGMSDHISFNLAAAGYNVAKYLPYGPVKHVLPYLTRRVEENTSVKGQTSRELNLISKEFKRRKKWNNFKHRKEQ
jgi:proline dehydrogenase